MITNTSKKKEIILAAYVGMHTSIRSVDHLSEIFVNFTQRISASSSTCNSVRDQETIRLHRTKCAAIIRNVIGPSLLEDLINDIGTSPFSLIVDESTDVSTEKLLCINIRYYSKKGNDIVTHF